MVVVSSLLVRSFLSLIFSMRGQPLSGKRGGGEKEWRGGKEKKKKKNCQSSVFQFPRERKEALLKPPLFLPKSGQNECLRRDFFYQKGELFQFGWDVLVMFENRLVNS